MTSRKLCKTPLCRQDIDRQWNWTKMGQDGLFLVYWVQLPHPRHRTPSAALTQHRAARVMNSYDTLRLSLVNLSRVPLEAQVSHRAAFARKVGVILGVPAQNLIGIGMDGSKRRDPLPALAALKASAAHIHDHIYCIGRPGLTTPRLGHIYHPDAARSGKIHVLGLLDAREPAETGCASDIDSALLSDLRWHNPFIEIVRCGIDGLTTVNGTGLLDVQRGRAHGRLA